MKLSDQQKDIIGSPLSPVAVSACAGSGKTATAVRRLAEMRSRLDDRHGILALLSFSNVAVDTFNRDYRELSATQEGFRQGVEIDTVDGFITSNILRPHGPLAMGCTRTPFLVHGAEPFLKSFSVWDGSRSLPTADLKIGVEDNAFTFKIGHTGTVGTQDATKALAKLGAVGAYTHSSARYWVLRVLRENKFVLRALVRRYPHILVDEAQDVGLEHEAILNLMMEHGSQVSLIGDSNQGIYEFSGAGGSFFVDYPNRKGVTERKLEINYRSVPRIVTIANKLSGRDDKPDRVQPATLNGAYYVPYKSDEKDKLLATFNSMLKKAAIDPGKAVVLCRSAKWAADWAGGDNLQGQGAVYHFGQAAVLRERGRYREAFSAGCSGIVGLLSPKHDDLLSLLIGPSVTPAITRLRRVLWRFLRDPVEGLPAATLTGETDWHPQLVSKAKKLVETLAADFGLEPGDNLGNKLAKKKMKNEPLYEIPDLAQDNVPRFRVSTVHRVKGESIDGVMYVCNKKHVEEFLEGTGTEVGKIGYVALTRARNFFLLAVPSSSLTELEPQLIAAGIEKAAL